MTYNRELAHRIRAALGEHDVREVPMFGGLTFMVCGRMTATANTHGDLMVRCDPARADELLTKPEASWPEMRGKPMSKGWIAVSADGITSDADLAAWIGEAVAYTMKEAND
jgi:hypothetical protein